MRSLLGILMVLAIAVPLVSSCSTSYEKKSGDFEQVSQEMNQMAVMPPGFILQEVAAFADQAVSEMTHDIEMEIKSAVEAVIAGSEFDVASLDISDEALAADPEMRRVIFAQSEAVEAAVKAVYDTDGKIIDVEYWGDVDFFADKADCDHLLFVDGYGYFQTTGAQIKGAILAGIFGGSSAPASGTTMRAFIVDANRGKVVWFNQVAKANHDPRKPTHLLKTSKDLFKPLLGKSDVKGDKSRDDEIINKYKEKMKAIEQEEKADG